MLLSSSRVPCTRIIALQSVDSTNAEAQRRAAAGEAPPFWVMAETQTAGRGRAGRSWTSARGNLQASLLIRLADASPKAYQLSLVAGVAVIDAIRAACPLPEGTQLRLKWPNDILIDGAKVGGVLVESSSRAGGLEAAVGIGINLASHPENLGRAVTHLGAHAPAPAPAELLASIVEAMQRWLSVWDEGDGFAPVRAAWLRGSGNPGEALSINTGAETVAGAFNGLDADGALLLRDAEGRERRFQLWRCDASPLSRAESAAARGKVAMADDRQHGGRRAQSDELVFLPLGGAGEIGMNAYLYGLGPADRRQWLMVDLGITFPEGEDDPGIDVIFPDLRFIEAEKQALVGLVITHAHEDHIGAVIDLWPRLGVPVYVTPFTGGMLRSKLAEYGGKLTIPVTEVPLDSRFKVGPFDLELISMAHSIPESSALAIRTRHGLVLHTGDWKLDAAPYIGKPSDESRLAALGDEGVAAVICDSTNAMRDGRSPSETEVAASLASIIKGARGCVAVTTFSSNVARIKGVAAAAEAAGRELVVAGRALHRVIEVAIDTGYLPKHFTYLDQQEFQRLAPRDVVCLCTGSQGEPRAAMARIAAEEHPEITLGKGDLVIFSSRTIPGNEKAVAKIENALVRRGCELLTSDDALVHVTGHPRRDELRQLYAWTRPRVAVPMHGEARHLKAHADLARAAGVPEVAIAYNGEVLRLAPGPASVIDEAPVGRLFRDGRLIVPSDEGPVRERRKLAAVGLIAVSLVLSRKGEVLADPEIVLDGVPWEDQEGTPMIEVVADAVEGTLKSIPTPRRRDQELVAEAVRRAVRAAVANTWGKKPIAKVLISMIDTR